MKNLYLHPIAFVVIVVISILFFIAFPFSDISAQPSRDVTRYVKPSGTGDCSSWANACKLGIALTASVSGDQIWVASGTYKPGAVRNLSFQLKSGVEIYGGFPAAGGNWASRDWEANPTVLSADIGTSGEVGDNNYHVVTANNVDSTAVLDGFTVGDGYANGTDDPNWYGAGMLLIGSSPVLRNLLITDNTVPNGSGGGVYSYQGSPILENVTMTNNTSNSGGGMYSGEGSPSLTDVTFSNNTALFWGGGLNTEYTGTPTLNNVTFTDNAVTGSPPDAPICQGGGMSVAWGNTPSLTTVTFTDNTSAYNGGGLFSGYNSSMTLTDVTFSGNSANRDGGGMYTNTTGSVNLTNVSFTNNSSENYSGGGLYNTGSGSTVLSNATFTSNSAYKTGGGMMSNSNNSTLTNVVFNGNQSESAEGGGFSTSNCSPTLTDVSFINNSAASFGGGAFHLGGSPNYTNITFSGNTAQSGGGMTNMMISSPTLINVTFSENEASDQGGAIYNTNSINLSLKNVTIYLNSAGNQGGAISQLTSTTTMINSIVWGNLPSGSQIYNGVGSTANITYSDVQGGWTGETNLNQDPQLGTLADNGGFTQTHALIFGSPVIDKASPSDYPVTDQRGVDRPFDGDDDGEAECDMGAFELDHVPTYGNVKITKSFDPQTSGFTGSFTISYDCDDGTDHDGTVQLAAGESANINGILVGTTCTVTEDHLPAAPEGWSFETPTFNPQNGMITVNQPDQVHVITVTNSIHSSVSQLKFFLPLFMGE